MILQFQTQNFSWMKLTPTCCHSYQVCLCDIEVHVHGHDGHRACVLLLGSLCDYRSWILTWDLSNQELDQGSWGSCWYVFGLEAGAWLFCWTLPWWREWQASDNPLMSYSLTIAHVRHTKHKQIGRLLYPRPIKTGAFSRKKQTMNQMQRLNKEIAVYFGLLPLFHI